MWYRFVAWNQESGYGWTTSPEVVEAVVENLNRGRSEEQHYAAVALGDTEDTEYQPGRKLKDFQGLLCDDDTSVADVKALHDEEVEF